MRHLCTLAMLALAASALQAQNIKPGAQLSLSFPQGDMGNSDYLDGQLGVGLGAHVLVDLNGGHAIVPRVDYTMYKKSSYQGYSGLDFKVSDLKLGVDYNYFIDGKANQGAYLLGGLGYSSAKWELSAGPFAYSQTKGAAYIAIGGGYDFNANVGAELRYTHAKYNNVADSGLDLTGPAFNASVTFRF